MIVKIVRPIFLGAETLPPGRIVDTATWRPKSVRHFLESGRIEPYTENPTDRAAVATVLRKEAT